MSVFARTIDVKGTEAQKVKLPEKLFAVNASPILAATAVRVYLSNKRRSMAKTKTRSEVIRTTAKMYRQKGTGRARHGAYSAPIFVGGGVAHGPSGEQNYRKELNKKNKFRSLASALSDKAKNEMITLFSEPNKFEGKTKEIKPLVQKLIKGKETLLVVTAEKQNILRRAFMNLQRVKTATPNQLNTYLILNTSKLLFTDESLKETQDRFIK